MRNIAFEQEIIAQQAHQVGPLSFWRTLPASTFAERAAIVEAAIVSIITVSRLAPPALIAELTTAQEEERTPVWNDLAVHFTALDAMMNGVPAEISGSCAALSAHAVDPLGLVLLLNRLSQPFVGLDLCTRLSIGATWLEARGTLLNQRTLSHVDWFQTGRGNQFDIMLDDDAF